MDLILEKVVKSCFLSWAHTWKDTTEHTEQANLLPPKAEVDSYPYGDNILMSSQQWVQQFADSATEQNRGWLPSAPIKVWPTGIIKKLLFLYFVK